MPFAATLTPEQKDTALHADDPALAPSMDMSDMENKKASSDIDVRHLESLKVSDDELVGSLTYNQLSLYEKKSYVDPPLDRKTLFPTYAASISTGFS